jgi:hypothetical protein
VKLWGANLRGANLEGANLEGANLEGANLEGENLEGENLEGENMEGANLEGANLWGAKLRGANLEGANLEGANLEGVTLDDATILPTGETWKVYRTEVVPSLLSNSLKIETLVAESWNVHSWSGCPMAMRFHTDKLEGVPALLRPRVEQFVQFFDARLLDGLPEEMGWIQKEPRPARPTKNNRGQQARPGK